MPTPLSDILKSLPPGRRSRIEADAARDVAKIMSLRDMRKARQLSQEQLADALGMEQESVSRLERRDDLLLSTMRKYVAAMGGELRLIAEFPDQPPIRIKTLGELRRQRVGGKLVNTRGTTKR
jgi:DNA-binding XRE family transcriptional regulator